MSTTSPMSTSQKIERAVVAALVAEVGKAGYVPVNVWDGGEYVEATTAEAVIEAVLAVAESTIHFAPADDLKNWGRRGVLVVPGNGEDCISDWHTGDATFSAAVERGSNLAVSV